MHLSSAILNMLLLFIVCLNADILGTRQIINRINATWRPKPLGSQIGCPNITNYNRVATHYLSYNWWMTRNNNHNNPENDAFYWGSMEDYKPINIASFVEIMQGRILYIVGDSLSMQTYKAFACVLSNEINLTATMEAENDLRSNFKGIIPNISSPGVFVLNKGGRVELLFSDKLTKNDSQLSSNYYWDPSGNRLQIAWNKRIEKRKNKLQQNDILLINTGAHFFKCVTSPQLNDSSCTDYTKTIIAVFTWMKEKYKGHVVWRDFYEGLSSGILCQKFDSEKWMELLRNRRRKCQYNWCNAVDMNTFSLKTAQRLQMNMTFMNVNAMMTQRCDRKDPLHFDTAGPTNEWVRQFYFGILPYLHDFNHVNHVISKHGSSFLMINNGEMYSMIEYNALNIAAILFFICAVIIRNFVNVRYLIAFCL
eukprot:180692_1